MKHSRQNYIILGGLILVALIAIGGVYYFGVQIKRADDSIQVVNPIFVRNIGPYVLVAGDNDFAEEECSFIEDHRDTSRLGLTGEICELSMGAEYKDPDSKKVVFVHVVRISKNQDLYQELLERISTKDDLGSYPIIRIEGWEIGWLPIDNYNLIITQEGSITIDGFEYATKASGINEVTQHFIGRFPPKIP